MLGCVPILSNSLADVQVVAAQQDEFNLFLCCMPKYVMCLSLEIQFKGDLLEFQLHKYCDLSGTYAHT